MLLSWVYGLRKRTKACFPFLQFLQKPVPNCRMVERNISKLLSYFQRVEFEFEVSDAVKIVEVDGMNG